MDHQVCVCVCVCACVRVHVRVRVCACVCMIKLSRQASNPWTPSQSHHLSSLMHSLSNTSWIPVLNRVYMYMCIGIQLLLYMYFPPWPFFQYLVSGHFDNYTCTNAHCVQCTCTACALINIFSEQDCMITLTFTWYIHVYTCTYSKIAEHYPSILLED